MEYGHGNFTDYVNRWRLWCIDLILLVSIKLKRDMLIYAPIFERKHEEVVTSDPVAGGFPADMGEGGVNFALQL